MDVAIVFSSFATFPSFQIGVQFRVFSSVNLELKREFEAISFRKGKSGLLVLTFSLNFAWRLVQVTFRDPDSARMACMDPYPVIDGRRANCNLAILGRPGPDIPFGRSSSLVFSYPNCITVISIYYCFLQLKILL